MPINLTDEQIEKRVAEILFNKHTRLKNAGLPGRTSQIIGRRFIFVYCNGGGMEILVEGTIRSVTTMKGKNNDEIVQLATDPCIFHDQEVDHFENFCDAGLWLVYLKNKTNFLNGVYGELILK